MAQPAPLDVVKVFCPDKFAGEVCWRKFAGEGLLAKVCALVMGLWELEQPRTPSSCCRRGIQAVRRTGAGLAAGKRRGSHGTRT